jgi:hypothetical protein
MQDIKTDISPHSTPAIVKDVETADILKLSARSEFTASFRFSIVRKLMPTSYVTSLIVSSSKMKMMDTLNSVDKGTEKPKSLD